MNDLYDFPSEYIGRKLFVSVRNHSRSIPKYKTYKGSDGYNHLRPEFGGVLDCSISDSVFILPDKQPYLSPIDGSYVTSRSTHREHMKRNNVIEAGDMSIGHMNGVNRDAHRQVSGHDIADAIRQLGGD